MILGLAECTQIKEVILPHTELIYPTETGKFRITLVQDTSYTSAGKNDPVVDWYYKKETIQETETDLLGRELKKVLAETSPYERGTDFLFEAFRVLSIYKPQDPGPDYFAERTEENDRVLLLKFPVHTTVAWNGNLYNDLGQDNNTNTFYYEEVDTTVTVLGKTYENCVMVVHEKTDGVIRKAFSYEIYAPNIGLIKKYINIEVNDRAGTDPFNSEESMIYLEEIIDHN